MNTGLEGRCVLVTGASGGIGQAVAAAFAAEGARLVLHYHRNGDMAAALLERFPGRAAAVQADLRDESQTEALFAKALEAVGRIDVAGVNAGAWTTASVPLHEMTLAQWRLTLEVDLTSAFLTCRGFLRHLAAAPRENAAIVLVGSTAGIFGEADHADYAAAKAGMVHGLTLSLKNEIVRLAPKGRVNCVCPGWTDTPMASGQLADKNLLRRIMATRPLKAVARPEDVAAAVVFLASDSLAGHLSGVILPVAGGMEGRLLRE